ncbi:hypothetical protein Cgig2_013666 [Carnegiea gigantea]|uniref:Uncharacterized protein n=1 Tax=Carnegiea gigantea TaxID=171969 RepID=A0A9Q1GXU7_9CARY|nr:hypothetical protein Cgig2_013666 [Carnegiea gigantea]
MASPRKRKKPPDFLTNSQLGFQKFQSCPLFRLPGLQTINLNLECAQPSSEFAFRPFYICFVLESYNHSHTSASLLWLYRVDEIPMAPCNWITIMLHFRALSCLGSSSPISPKSTKQKSVLPAFSRFEVLTFRFDKEGLRTSDSLKVVGFYVLLSILALCCHIQFQWIGDSTVCVAVTFTTKLSYGARGELLFFSSDVAAQFSCILAPYIFTGMNGVIVTSALTLYEIIIFPKFLLVSGIKLYRLLPKAVLPTDPMDQMIQHEHSLHWNSFNHHCFS